MMRSTRELKTIVRNLITLYLSGAYKDLLTYHQALSEGLNRHDLAAVKQAFRHRVNTRRS